MEEIKDLKKLKIVSNNKLVVDNKKQTRKEYLKEYYQKNKQRINSKACEKVQCVFCLRNVCKGALEKHLKSNLCAKEIKRRIEKERKLKEIETLINSPPV